LKSIRIQLPYNLRLLLTYIFVIVVFQVVPVDIFYEWGWQEPLFEGVTVNHILRVLLFFPWMIIAWLIIYDGYENDVSVFRVILHGFGWLFMGLSFALIAEMSQFYLPYRVFSRTDAILNCAGVLAGSFIMFFKPNTIWRLIIKRL
jgi:glycopeptide antibiotics resistance protein